MLALAGHPIRWALLSELARSDRRVRELAAATGEPQSLVSYHLGRLRSAELIAAQRSSFDGRDSYYRLELDRCGTLLAQAGAALHPALALLPPSPARPRPARVLFLCTGNSSRSQMAEALVRDMAPAGTKVVSAGSDPKPVHPDAVSAMRERGIDITAARSQHLSTFAARRFDHVITLCDRVREVCPEFPGGPQAVHWSIADPARDAAGYPAFVRTADEVERRIRFFLHVLSTPEVN